MAVDPRVPTEYVRIVMELAWIEGIVLRLLPDIASPAEILRNCVLKKNYLANQLAAKSGELTKVAVLHAFFPKSGSF